MNRAELRQIEHVSIRDFLLQHREYLMGRVLDYGCGMPPHAVQPYRNIIEAQITAHGRGEYVPFDRQGYADPGGRFDCVLLTQVIQYIPNPLELLSRLRLRTTYLVLTYPTHWEEVETSDLWRFTKHGMERLLRDAGFETRIHRQRWSLPYDDFKLAGGYGAVAERDGGADHARA